MSYLVFQMKLRQSATLISGTLYARSPDGQNTLVLKASSGAPGFQVAKYQNKPSKGPIPACKAVGLQSFMVDTQPTVSEKPGIAGNFYHITPDPMYIQRVKRSEFGIHFDANFATAPGSAGCIVLLNKTEWTAFKAFMKGYASKGFRVISLIVEYA